LDAIARPREVDEAVYVAVLGLNLSLLL